MAGGLASGLFGELEMSDIKKVERDGNTTRSFYESGESVVIHSSEEAAEQYEKAVKAEIAKTKPKKD